MDNVDVILRLDILDWIRTTVTKMMDPAGERDTSLVRMVLVYPVERIILNSRTIMISAPRKQDVPGTKK